MTTPGEQNDLLQLEAKIRGLPVQGELLRQRRLFRSARDEARQRHLDLQVALEQVRALRRIQDNVSLLVDSEQRKLATVRTKGREVVNLLGEANPESDKFGEKLEAIKRATKGLSDEAKATWGALCKDHQERANALRALARLSASLAQCLQNLDQLLRAEGTDPPTAPQSVQAIVEARKALTTEIGSLDMNGPVESFLRDAQNGIGDPRALLDPTVRAYLDTHPALWKAIRVVLN